MRTSTPPLLDPVSAVQVTWVAVFDVEGTSIVTTLRFVGSVSTVAPAVLTSEYWPVPLALYALTFTLMRLSLGSKVKERMVLIGTVHYLADTMPVALPSQ